MSLYGSLLPLEPIKYWFKTLFLINEMLSIFLIKSTLINGQNNLKKKIKYLNSIKSAPNCSPSTCINTLTFGHLTHQRL